MQDYLKTHGLSSLKQLLYSYSDQFEYATILDSCELRTGVYGGDYEFLAAFGVENIYQTYNDIDAALGQKKWLFGILGYDLKNQFENLTSLNTAIIETPEILFFEPEIIVAIDKYNHVTLLKGNLTDDFWKPKIKIKPRDISKSQSPISKSIYLKKIEDIHELIRNGDVYELNYCVPFSHTYSSFDPLSFHLDLLKKSPVPMASYLQAKNFFLCGASMERYILKNGTRIISQPIKGTIRKGMTPSEDAALIEQLETSEKDRAENVMIVDLVRNDLNRICKKGTVKVDELFGIYSYLQVHQMISSIVGEIKSDLTFSEILKTTFPMGSMTGAPKIAAMQHIDELEDFKRGWYSGAVGYLSPNGDFDFNVVIRSVLCDTSKKIINYNAGGAITIDSDPEKEWEEVQLKTKAITEVLAH